MAYSKNPYLPRVRRDAADLVRRGWGVRKVARHIGVSPGTISKWVKKAQTIGYNPIPTLSSRPKSHPRQLSRELIEKICKKRNIMKRSAEVVHKELINDGILVSLSSVKRTLDRTGLLNKRSPWKRYHPPMPRPDIEKQGDLVQVDTVHLISPDGRFMCSHSLMSGPAGRMRERILMQIRRQPCASYRARNALPASISRRCRVIMEVSSRNGSLTGYSRSIGTRA